jgi:hypothetical protein
LVPLMIRPLSGRGLAGQAAVAIMTNRALPRQCRAGFRSAFSDGCLRNGYVPFIRRPRPEDFFGRRNFA